MKPNPQQLRAFDEASAFLADNLPGMWRRLYEGCLTAGFTEPHAMELLKTYILSQCPHGIRGTD